MNRAGEEEGVCKPSISLWLESGRARVRRMNAGRLEKNERSSRMRHMDRYDI